MNRPNAKDYWYVDTIEKLDYEEYAKDLEKYCDELELNNGYITMNADAFLDEIKKLNKALDKACEELENYSSHSYYPEYILKDSWKKWLMKDE